MSDEDLEAAVAAYRAELCAEAELARGDLDEIEDHLRALIEELRAAGTADVVAVARRRLGDPRAVAREHARVGTPFGTRPSRAQAWSAALLIGPLALWAAWGTVRTGGLGARVGLELALSALTLAALIGRQAWARAVVLGHAATMIVPSALGVWLWPDPRVAMMMVSVYAGVTAFLWPRQRGELSATGAALALLAPAYSGAVIALSFQISAPGGIVVGGPVAMVAMIAAVAASAGLLVRARWGCVAAAVAAVALATCAWQMAGLRWRFEHPDVQRAMFLAWIGGGALAAAAAAVIAWRGARGGVGTLRGVVHLS